MVKSSKKMWALVKWLEDKTYTVGIDTAHIKNFDYDRYTDENEDPGKVYVVEWHDTPKEPLGGWQCYNALIMAVSGSLSILKKKLTALDGIESPKRTIDEELNNQEMSLQQKNPLENSLENAEFIEVGTAKSSQDDVDKDIDITDDRKFKKSEKKLTPKRLLISDDSDDTDGTSQKEIGRPGSNVFIPYSEFSRAECTVSPTAMATCLLTVVFPEKILVQSNYKGGPAKNTKDVTIRHLALDKKKIEAIKETVKQRFGKDFKEGDFGRAINVKCNKLREAARRRKVEESKK